MPVVAGGAPSHDKIALIDVDGLLLNKPAAGMNSLGENPVSAFREKLDRVAADPSYRAVVMRINSPGGGVTATDIMWRDLKTFRSRTGLPVVACLMDLGAGGAYYLAVAADHIMAHPTTLVGGVGVIFNVYNLQDAMMQFNIFAAPIKAGRHIDLGTPIEPLDDESAQILQRIADQYQARFRNVVQEARPGLDADGGQVFDGRVLLADEALRRKLIDSIGYLDDAIAAAQRLAGAPSASVVMLHRCNDRASSPYAVSPNTPIQTGMLPLSMPGLERAQLPAFLYLWQPEPTLERRAAGG
jgi:protease-4